MAISKERLEQLIEQGATVWSEDWNEEVVLSKKNCEIHNIYDERDIPVATKLFVREDDLHCPSYSIHWLTEDVETAKWHYEMDCERTEKLVLPTWEEFLNKNVGIHFYKNGCEYGLHKARYSEDDENPDWRVEVYRNYDPFDYNDELFSKLLTKENYTEACLLARKLFLGESENE